jgi:dienelactone hydrolase
VPLQRRSDMRVVRSLLPAAFLLVATVVTAAYGFIHGWYVTRLDPAELNVLLEPGYEIFRPAGAGRFPAVVQFHGCGGVFDNQRVWARVFRDAGFVGVVVDSNGPRGLSSADVCGGRALLGGERAGDVLVALDRVRSLPFVDPQRIILAGWSHGSWSIMDLLAMRPPEELPYNLAEMPDGGLDGIAGLIFVYPYCGFPTRSEPWPNRHRTFFLLAGVDSVAPTAQCMELVGALRAKGHNVRVTSLEGIDHAFDERVHGNGSHLVYDAEATHRAHLESLEFLTEISSSWETSAAGAHSSALRLQ